jgi:hypothetical protein
MSAPFASRSTPSAPLDRFTGHMAVSVHFDWPSKAADPSSLSAQAVPRHQDSSPAKFHQMDTAEADMSHRKISASRRSDYDARKGKVPALNRLKCGATIRVRTARQ